VAHPERPPSQCPGAGHLRRSRPQANGPFRSGLHVAVRSHTAVRAKAHQRFPGVDRPRRVAARRVRGSCRRSGDARRPSDGRAAGGRCRVYATVSGKDVTLALECRDHKRKADQIWIDTLRGKYSNLPAHRKDGGGRRQCFDRPAASWTVCPRRQAARCCDSATAQSDRSVTEALSGPVCRLGDSDFRPST